MFMGANRPPLPGGSRAVWVVPSLNLLPPKNRGCSIDEDSDTFRGPGWDARSASTAAGMNAARRGVPRSCFSGPGATGPSHCAAMVQRSPRMDARSGSSGADMLPPSLKGPERYQTGVWGCGWTCHSKANSQQTMSARLVSFSVLFPDEDICIYNSHSTIISWDSRY
jgi:hypothetical protein